MSEELVNQLTLSCLISKTQFQKLNKKLKDTTENNRKTDKEIYGERIQQIFSDLLVNNPPEDMLQDVKIGFDFFIDKCIYYFKTCDNHKLLDKEQTCDIIHDDVIHDDIDFEKEERDIERGDYQENSCEENSCEENSCEENSCEENSCEENSCEENSCEEDDSLNITKNFSYNKNIKTQEPIIVKTKYNRICNSVGVDDIQKLPIDWFQNVKQNNKKDHIIPRRKQNNS
jgi:hypothetical protein